MSNLDITNKIGRERIFKEYPLPEKYNNLNTTIKIYQLSRTFDFKIFAANPDFPPLMFNIETKKWEELTLGIPNDFI